jgi:hypothetical protein
VLEEGQAKAGGENEDEATGGEKEDEATGGENEDEAMVGTTNGFILRFFSGSNSRQCADKVEGS